MLCFGLTCSTKHIGKKHRRSDWAGSRLLNRVDYCRGNHHRGGRQRSCGAWIIGCRRRNLGFPGFFLRRLDTTFVFAGHRLLLAAPKLSTQGQRHFYDLRRAVHAFLSMRRPFPFRLAIEVL